MLGPADRRLAALQRHTGAAISAAAGAAAAALLPEPQQQHGLTDIERYWFDTQGFVVIPGVLSVEQVQACNDALEHNRELVNYTPLSEDGRAWVVPPSLAGSSDRPGRSQLSRCMELDPPWRATFREIFLLAKTLGCMQDLIGNGFSGTEGRILMQQNGGEGHALHGGGSTRDLGEADTTLTLGGNMSLFQNGQLWNSVMSVQYALCDINAGDGGVCAIPGSHKANYECPMPLRDCAVDMPGLVQVPFCEPFANVSVNI